MAHLEIPNLELLFCQNSPICCQDRPEGWQDSRPMRVAGVACARHLRYLQNIINQTILLLQIYDVMVLPNVLYYIYNQKAVINRLWCARICEHILHSPSQGEAESSSPRVPLRLQRSSGGNHTTRIILAWMTSEALKWKCLGQGVMFKQTNRKDIHLKV